MMAEQQRAAREHARAAESPRHSTAAPTSQSPPHSPKGGMMDEAKRMLAERRVARESLSPRRTPTQVEGADNLAVKAIAQSMLDSSSESDSDSS